MGLELLAFLAGLIGAVSTVPQIYQMVKSKQTIGISTQMFMMKNVAYTMWMAFGYFSGSFAVILWNFFALVMSSAVIIMKYKILSEVRQKEAAVDFSQDEVVEAPGKRHLKLVYSKH